MTTRTISTTDGESVEVVYDMSIPADRDAYIIAINAHAVCATLQAIGDELRRMWLHENTPKMTGEQALLRIYEIWADAHSDATRAAMQAWGAPDAI